MKKSRSVRSTKTSKASVRSSKKQSLWSRFRSSPRNQVLVVAVLFGLVGAYFIGRSYANTTIGIHIAPRATNLTSQTNGPRVITDSTASKRNVQSVYVASSGGAENQVSVTQVLKKGTWEVCSLGRPTVTGASGKLRVADKPYGTATSLAVEEAFKATSPTEYIKLACPIITLPADTTVYISHAVSAGAYNFSTDAITEKPAPPTSGLPTPETTGYLPTGVTLKSCEQFKDSRGNYTINGGTNGITVDGCNFPGNVIVTGGGPIVIKRSLIKPAGSSSTSDDATSGPGVEIGRITGSLVIEDTEIVSANLTDPKQTGRIMYRPIVNRPGNRAPVTLTRVYAHGARSGSDFTATHNVTISSSYLGPNYNPVLPSQTTTTCTNRVEDRQHGSGLRLAGDVVKLRVLNTAIIGGFCDNMSGIMATYEEQGDNHDIVVDGGLWEFGAGAEGFGIAAGWTKSSGNRNYDFTVKNLQISTRFVPSGCTQGCAQNWDRVNNPALAPLDSPKVWQNVTKYNPGKPDHGQPIK